MASEHQVFLIDPQLAGMSGDMFVAGLIDLGASEKRILDAIRGCRSYVKGCSKLSCDAVDVKRSGFRAKRLLLELKEDIRERNGRELRTAVRRRVRDLKLSKEAQSFSSRSIDILVKVEAQLHGEAEDEVELHEAGSIDTLVDIVASAVGLDDLGLFTSSTCYTTPVRLGGGRFRFSHGDVTSPGPATLEILKSAGLLVEGGPAKAELATPTGAALLAALSPISLETYPLIRPEKVGYGAGEKDFPGFPNVLRLVIGKEIEPSFSDRVAILETNIDDVGGEVLGYAAERLMKAGAKDVSFIPIYAKKQRPGYMVKAIVDAKDAEYLSEVMMQETGSLGVRVTSGVRHILARKIVPVEMKIKGSKHKVGVKVSRDTSGKIVSLKPEYEDARKIAVETGTPIRLVMEDAVEEAKRQLK